MHLFFLQINSEGVLEKNLLTIPELTPTSITVEAFLAAIIRTLVAQYNKGLIKQLPEFIDPSRENKEKGSFRLPFFQKPPEVDTNKAVETGLQAFKDGIFLLFHNQQKYTNSSQLINLQEKDECMLVKLSFISTGYVVTNRLHH